MTTKADLKPLHIAVVTETYPPEINGVANTMRHLVAGLTRRGHRLHLIRPHQHRGADQPDPAADTETLVPGLPLPGYRGLRLGLPVYWRIRRLWRQGHRPDIVYIATQGPLGHAALNAARRAGIPAITGFHTQFDQYSRHYGLGLLTQQIAQTLKHFHNRSHATLVPTPELRDHLTQEGFHNVHLFGRGVDTQLFDPARRNPTLRAAWGSDAGELVALYVGRLAAEKNLELALRSFQAIAAQDPSARLVLVGDGPGLEKLRHDYPDHRFVGPKVGEELAEHYASGDLFLFPSLTETFGNVVLEAMASGLGVVAFNYAAAHTYIASGRNGITVTPGDEEAYLTAAVEIAGDHERLSHLGRAARRTAERLDWDHVIAGIEEQLASIIRHGHRRAKRPETRAAVSH